MTVFSLREGRLFLDAVVHTLETSLSSEIYTEPTFESEFENPKNPVEKFNNWIESQELPKPLEASLEQFQKFDFETLANPKNSAGPKPTFYLFVTDSLPTLFHPRNDNSCQASLEILNRQSAGLEKEILQSLDLSPVDEDQSFRQISNELYETGFALDSTNQERLRLYYRPEQDYQVFSLELPPISLPDSAPLKLTETKDIEQFSDENIPDKLIESEGSVQIFSFQNTLIKTESGFSLFDAEGSEIAHVFINGQQITINEFAQKLAEGTFFTQNISGEEKCTESYSINKDLLLSKLGDKIPVSVTGIIEKIEEPKEIENIQIDSLTEIESINENAASNSAQVEGDQIKNSFFDSWQISNLFDFDWPTQQLKHPQQPSNPTYKNPLSPREVNLTYGQMEVVYTGSEIEISDESVRKIVNTSFSIPPLLDQKPIETSLIKTEIKSSQDKKTISTQKPEQYKAVRDTHDYLTHSIGRVTQIEDPANVVQLKWMGDKFINPNPTLEPITNGLKRFKLNIGNEEIGSNSSVVKRFSPKPTERPPLIEKLIPQHQTSFKANQVESQEKGRKLQQEQNSVSHVEAKSGSKNQVARSLIATEAQVERQQKSQEQNQEKTEKLQTRQNKINRAKTEINTKDQASKESIVAKERVDTTKNQTNKKSVVIKKQIDTTKNSQQESRADKQQVTVIASSKAREIEQVQIESVTSKKLGLKEKVQAKETERIKASDKKLKHNMAATDNSPAKKSTTTSSVQVSHTKAFKQAKLKTQALPIGQCETIMSVVEPVIERFNKRAEYENKMQRISIEGKDGLIATDQIRPLEHLTEQICSLIYESPESELVVKVNPKLVKFNPNIENPIVKAEILTKVDQEFRIMDPSLDLKIEMEYKA